MAVYAIGDLQGCYDELQRLLEKLRFEPSTDRLWLTGDLVNRGPKSLEVLRFVRGLGDAAVAVLGNHDLHLLAVHHDKHRHFKSNDTLQPILAAPDREELLDWLRQLPLLHHDEALDAVMVHAGLPPQWDLTTARRCAAEVEEVLRGPLLVEFLEHMYGNRPHLWSPALQGWERLRFSVNCFTRLRFCTPEGRLDFERKGRPGSQEGPYLPWFQVPGRRSAEVRIIFGHWSTLGLHLNDGVRGIDTGCLWGGTLTALRLDDSSDTVVSIACPQGARPG